MSEITLLSQQNKNYTISKVLSDPKFYFTVALFAGEAGPKGLPISSGWMFIFCFLGLTVLVAKRTFKVRKNFSLAILTFVVVILRNISFNPEIINYYELPCLGTALILIILNCVFYKEDDINQILGYIFIYATILAFLGIIQFLRHPTVRLAVFGGPNGYYKIALLFEVLCFYSFIQTNKYIYTVGAGLGLVLCIATGSKGGIASMIVILLLELLHYLFNAGKRRGYLIKRIIQIAIIAFVGFFLVSAIVSKLPGLSIMLNRASSFLTTDNALDYTSISSRTYLVKLGMHFFKENPIIGKGARYTYFYTNGVFPYPHNIFVEFLSEQGVLGTIPFVLFLVSILSDTLKYGIRNQKLFCIFLCFAVYFSGAMFSGNILDAKPIFVFGILLHNSTLNYKYYHSRPNGGIK